MHPQSNTSPDLILCACGCGQSRPRYDSRGDERKYIYHHKQGTLGTKRTPEANARTSASLKHYHLEHPEAGQRIAEANRAAIRRDPTLISRRKVAGPQHPMWNGGRRYDRGYVSVYMPKHPAASRGYVREHRLVMERILGRYLEPTEIVHHIDGNLLNNDPANLRLFESRSAHTRWHYETNPPPRDERAKWVRRDTPCEQQ